jgi:hypothetical protein
MRRSIARLIAGIVGAAALALPVIAVTSSLGTFEPCQTLELPENGPQVDVDGLMAQGWYSDPTDHAERLYAPSCRH